MTDDAFWQGRSVFVTGATGVVGSWLVKELIRRDANVVALIQDSNPRSELFRSGDIRRISVVNGALEDFSTLERTVNLYETEAVFHLGAQTIVSVAQRSPLPTFESNIRGTYNLLECCRLHSNLLKRVVIASSDKAYGNTGQLPYREEMTLCGRDPYEVSKTCADLIGQSYHSTYGLPVGIARCGNVYGGGDLNWSRLVPSVIRACLKKERPIIRSDGRYIRDYIYVKDVVLAYLRLAECLDQERVQGEAFNFSAETPTTVMEMVATILQIMNCEDLTPDIRNSAQGEITHQYLSAAKARSVLGWQPQFTRAAAVLETINWYRGLLERGYE